MTQAKWPRWYYGPKGEAQVFESQDEVPDGWAETPAAFAGGGETAPQAADQIAPDKAGPGDNLSVTVPPPAPDDAEVTNPVNPRIRARATGTLPMDTAGRAAAQAATATEKG